MSKRLDSFAGPSTPSSAPIQNQSSDTTPTKPKSGAKNKNKGRDATPSSPSPLSPSREPKSPPAQRPLKTGASGPSLGSRASVHASAMSKNKPTTFSESPLQLYTRTALKRVAAELEVWYTCISRRGLASAKLLIDKATEFDNALSILPEGAQPRSRMLGPRLKELNTKRSELRGHLAISDDSFTYMAELAAKMETALAKLTQRDGQELTESDPVWGETSWSFAFYVSHVIKILRQLNRTRYTLNGLAELIISYSLSSPFHSSHPTDSQAAPSSTETRQIPLPPSGASLTFHEARTVLAAFSGEASRTSELIKEWVAACTVEVPAWDEIKVEMVASDDEYDLETL